MAEKLTAESLALLAEYRRWFARQGWEQEGWDAAKSEAALKDDLAAIEAAAVRDWRTSADEALRLHAEEPLHGQRAVADWLASPEAEKALIAALYAVVRQFLPSYRGGLYEHEDGTWQVGCDWKWAAHHLLAALREPPREGSV